MMWPFFRYRVESDTDFFMGRYFLDLCPIYPWTLLWVSCSIYGLISSLFFFTCMLHFMFATVRVFGRIITNRGLMQCRAITFLPKGSLGNLSMYERGVVASRHCSLSKSFLWEFVEFSNFNNGSLGKI